MGIQNFDEGKSRCVNPMSAEKKNYSTSFTTLGFIMNGGLEC
jgi:hypothetical protein